MLERSPSNNDAASFSVEQRAESAKNPLENHQEIVAKASELRTNLNPQRELIERTGVRFGAAASGMEGMAVERQRQGAHDQNYVALAREIATKFQAESGSSDPKVQNQLETEAMRVVDRELYAYLKTQLTSNPEAVSKNEALAENALAVLIPWLTNHIAEFHKVDASEPRVKTEAEKIVIGYIDSLRSPQKLEKTLAHIKSPKKLSLSNFREVFQAFSLKSSAKSLKF